MRFYGKYANIFGKKDIFYIFLNVIVYVPYKSIEVNCNTLTHTKKRLYIGTMRDFNIFRFFCEEVFLYGDAQKFLYSWFEFVMQRTNTGTIK